jgi:UDP-hydrolysing UDP-N-acetyl-D-glucosamine 2-epimerase
MRVTAVSVGRSDYGLYRPVLAALAADPHIEVDVVAAAAHLSDEFGLTIREIEADGHTITARVEMTPTSDSPDAVAKSIGIGVVGFAETYSRKRPDLLLILGDRYEMLAAAAAAVPYNIMIGHLHGGESSEGAIDEQIRHALTKLSHIHFVATGEASARVQQMGEEPWRVVITGAPGLDTLRGFRATPRVDLEDRFNLDLSEPTLLITYHPVTLEPDRLRPQIAELQAALHELNCNCIVTCPGADAGARTIWQEFQSYASSHPKCRLVTNLGTQLYYSLQATVTAMVGNSSSGIIEAPSFQLPVVNVGDRQRGRLRARNVIDVPCTRADIAAGVSMAMSSAFRDGLRELVNPYGDGHAAERIVRFIHEVKPNARWLEKRFCDMPTTPNELAQ